MRGFTDAGLARLRRVLQGHVARGEVAGIVALVARDDTVHVEALGRQAVGSPAPMRRDTVFRIASLSKPVTAAAAMLLVEDCRLRLDDPVDRWLPELAGRRVLRSLASPLDDTVPAARAITPRDLLTSCMGFGSVMAPPGTHPIQRAIAELRIGGDGPAPPSADVGVDEWLRRLGSLPLLAQPGERWMYHVSLDVLGALVARAAGQRLGDFLQERLFAPLGMRDTGFRVRDDQRDRLAVCYRVDRARGALVVWDGVEDSAWRDPSAFESGAGGLVSTADDLLAFCRMLRDGGRHGAGARILSPATVALMTADQVAPAAREGAETFFGAASSWGFGMAVALRRDEIFRTPGRFGWDGGFGTSAYTDPAEGVIGILLTQLLVDSPAMPALYSDFWTSAYAALD